MTDSPVRYDFPHFCQVFHAWFATHGLSQAKVAAAGGPSKPIQSQLIAGTWTSARPADITDKVDIGFRWPAGTAWKVLTQQLDPMSDPPGVSLAKTIPPSRRPDDDHDSLLYRRPDGLSDAEWEKLKTDTREYLEWLIEKAARER